MDCKINKKYLYFSLFALIFLISIFGFSKLIKADSTLCNNADTCDGGCDANGNNCVGYSCGANPAPISCDCGTQVASCSDNNPSSYSCGSSSCSAGQSCSCGGGTHLECQSNACVSVPGAGSDLCTNDTQCQPTHSECQFGACVSVSGAGSDQCASNSDCASGPYCGDGNCTNGETNATCPQDCPSGAGVCPTTNNQVALNSSSITVGSTTQAYAPAGYSNPGGAGFASDNPGVASTDSSVPANVTGVSSGSANISGSGFYYAPNNASNCTLAPATVTVTGGGSGPSNSACVNITAPSTVTAGQSFSASVTMQNTGGTTWQSIGVNPSQPFRIGSQTPQDNTNWGVSRVDMPVGTVAPGNSVTFNFTPTAPNSPGSYNFDWQMLQETVPWFGQVCSKPLTVVPTSVPINGSCGTASGKTYPNGTVGYGSDTQCGNGNPSNTAFPAAGASVNWTCSGQNGGSPSGTCTASQSAAACTPPTTGTVSAVPSTVAPGGSFDLRCDFGSSNDFIPAPAGCSWPGSNGGHIGSAATFACTAPNTTGPYTVTCQPTNQPGFTNFCSQPNAVSTTVNVTAAPAPILSISPASFSFNATQGGANPTDQPLTISNTGPNGTSLHWTLSNTGSWLTAMRSSPGQQTSGTETSGGTATPAPVASVNISGLTAGTYNATITVSSDGGNASIPVTLTITAAPPGGGGGPTVTAVPRSCPATGVHLSWGPGAGATGYNIYRNTSNSIPGSPTFSNVPVQGGNIGTQTYDDPASGGPYYYWVESLGGDGTKVAANTNGSGGVSANSCGGGPGPASMTLINTTCQQIKMYWDSVNGASGYNVYRANGSGPFSSATQIASNVPLATSASPYTDTSVSGGQTYSYWVTAIAGGESLPTAGSQNPVGVSTCAPQLSSSDKDIFGLNGSTYVTGDCDGFQNGPPGSTYALGDRVGFKITLCNTGSSNATSITLTDSLTNLVRYDNTKPINTLAAWNASYDGGGTLSVSQVSGTEAAGNLVIKFTLTGEVILPNLGTHHLKFWAKTQLPANFNGASSRFQNSATINYNGGSTSTVSTPLLLFSGSAVPTRGEVGQ